jgi:hypothetical protein
LSSSPPNKGVTHVNIFGKNHVEVGAYMAKPVHIITTAKINIMRYDAAATALCPIGILLKLYSFSLNRKYHI